MNRHSIALGALGLAASAASAQSHVSLYGILDAAVEHLGNVGASGRSLTRMPGLTGGILASRLGVRGAEDLGGGLKAVFAVEQGFGLDGGTLNQGGRAFGRQAFVGLQGRWGTLSLGRQYSMLFWSQLEADLMGPAAFGSGSLDPYLPNARADNAIAYRGQFDGVTLGATYSFGRDAVNAGPSPGGTNCAGENGADARACRQWSALLKYDTPRWGVAAAVDEHRGGAGAFAGLTHSSLVDRRATLTGWVVLSCLKLGAGVIDRRNDGHAALPHTQLRYVGAAYAVTPSFTLDGALFSLGGRNAPDRATLLALRGVYTLSRRTAVYASAGRIDNDGAWAFSVSGAAPGGNPAPGAGQTGLAAGVRHSF
jgi:predicted porin